MAKIEEFKFSGEIISVNRNKKKAKVVIEVPPADAAKIPTGEVVMTGHLSQQPLFND